MRILVFPSISMRSYEDREDRWMLSSDAQLTKDLGYVKHLPDDWHWLFCLPKRSQQHEDLRWSPSTRNVQEWNMHWQHNVMEGRFYIDFDEVIAALASWKPDVVICEVPEQVKAFRCAMRRAGHSCPIVTVVVHVDPDEDQRAALLSGTLLKQIDGALRAELTVFTTEPIRDAWAGRAGVFKDELGLGIQVDVWGGLYEPDEIREAKRSGDLLRDSIGSLYGEELPIVFFASRLSDPLRTRYEELFAASNMLSSYVPHVLLVANPNEAKPWSWIREAAKSYVPSLTSSGEATLSRQDYLATLWAADVVPVMYPIDRIASIGACEAATARNAVVVAAAGDPSRQLGVPTGTEPMEIMETLRAVFSGSYGWLENLKTEAANEFEQAHSTKVWAPHVRKAIEKVIERVK